MTHYTITYACGHEGRVTLTGSKSTKEWILSKRKAELCPDCYRKRLEEERAAEREAAQEAAKEQELPELAGAPKQVAWAITIRAKYLELLEAELLSHKLSDKIDITVFQEAIESIQNEPTAKWWIENANTPLFDRRDLVRRYDNIMELRESTGCINAEEATRKATVRPESPVSELPAKIQIDKDIIYIKYPERNDTLREIVKEHGFRWYTDSWARRINPFAGTVEDRSGEIGNLLLKAGFIVEIIDGTAREKAISGNYDPEKTRWIKRLIDGKYKDYFSLTWEYGNQKIYDAARSIAGSRWNKPAVVIPGAQYEAILDLADEFGFTLSEGAERLAQEARQAKEATLVVKPGDAPEPIQKHTSTPGEIDDELRDDN